MWKTWRIKYWWLLNIYARLVIYQYHSITSKSTRPINTYIHQHINSSFVVIMASHRVDTKPVPKAMPVYCQLDHPRKKTFCQNITLIKTNWIGKCRLQNGDHFFSARFHSFCFISATLAPGRCGYGFMMTSSNGNIFRVAGHLCGEFTGHRWIPSTKASDTELWCFLWSAPE